MLINRTVPSMHNTPTTCVVYTCRGIQEFKTPRFLSESLTPDHGNKGIKVLFELPLTEKAGQSQGHY